MHTFLMRFFSRLSTREKLWVLIFTWAILFTWLFGLNKRFSYFYQNWKTTRAQVLNYRYWIKNEKHVQDNLTKVLQWIDPKKTFTGTQFACKIEELARKAELTYSMTSPKTREGDIFDAHTLQLHCENASLQTLILFEKYVYQTKPYIGLEKVRIRANEYAPSHVEADFDLIALQLKKIDTL